VLDRRSRAPVPHAGVMICDFDSFMARCEGDPTSSNFEVRRRIFEALAQEARCDEGGIARVYLSGRRYSIEAHHPEGLWGRALLSAPFPASIEVLLDEDLSVWARVTAVGDAQPISGAPLALLGGGGAVLRRSSGMDGLVEFEHAQRVFSAGAVAEVRFDAPLVTHAPARASEANHPGAPLPLPLPPHGTLEVLIRGADGKGIPGDRVQLEILAFSGPGRAVPQPWPGRVFRPTVDGAGMASLPFVGIGVALHVTARATGPDGSAEPIEQWCQGPNWMGEVCRVELDWIQGDADPVVVGRFVLEDGSPWPEGRVHLRPLANLHSGAAGPPRDVPISGDGRFRLTITKALDGPGGGHYAVTALEPERLRGVACRLDLSARSPRGETDVGDVLLDHGPPACSGRVVQDRGEPVPGATLSLRRRVEREGGEFWPQVPCSGQRRSNAEGEFELFTARQAEPPPAILWIEAQHPGYTTERIEVRPGQTDVQIELVQAGALEGSVELRGEQSIDEIAIQIQDARRIHTVELREDGSFRQEGLHPGPVRLRAHLRAGRVLPPPEERLTLENLEIVSGETNRDPRAQRITLQDDVHRLSLRIETTSGEPIPRALVLGDDFRSQVTDDDGRATLLVRTLPVDVRVAALGYRDVRLAGVGEDRIITLARGTMVRVRTDVPPSGERPQYRLSLFVYHTNDAGLRAALVFPPGLPTGQLDFDAASEVLLPMPGPGTYILEPHITVTGEDGVGRGGAIPLDPVRRIVVEDVIDVQAFDLHVPAGVLSEHVRRHGQ
jgi:hypothetical protein